ncbi:MAG: hypothetical protein HY807_01245 [Nitrospirae bacterium]|nr:hypothetical protein [Nitrospirota bacterium]
MPKMRKNPIFIVIPILLLASLSYAIEVAGVNMPDSLNAGKTALTLNVSH